MGKEGLQVIHAGYCKTGTKSVNAMLTQLGYKVCDAPEAIYRHWEDWERIANGEKPNEVLQKLFGAGNPDEYTACVDLPHFAFWEILLKQFPDAKVILAIRDEDKWANSVVKHLAVEREQFKEMGWWRLHSGIYKWVFNHSSRAVGLYMDWIRPLSIGAESRNFYGENMDLYRLKYRQHNQYVMNNCPKDKLLIWRIEDGWEPICKFLGKPVPDGPLPHCNRLGGVIKDLENSVDYQAMVRKQTISIVLRLAIIAATGYGWFKGLVQPHLQVEESMPFNWKMLAAGVAFLFTMRHL
ncbi:Oidioi.mRNA.OKI2018_I69.chr1.g1094.t1.cds [Oikopleura dioica]|uniref:Oidioi.mRNA.OKI2018_I69.chr1.g1094.t1.cds n=1 Tax=Oikopleura dioica TaxID=34765 RepID=A0ABN7SMD7_OIKDI|nr:Oidioi.mRNA.OKI2018_I69.chr1.g1094.t1.cds [Oikopleura dioica]